MPYKKDHAPTAFSQVLFELKVLLVAAGGSVKESGDGNATYNATGDCITSASVMAQQYAWWRVRLKDAGDGIIREITAQRYSGGFDSYWRIKYTCGTFTGGGGSATQTPAAADAETILAGGGTDGSPTFSDIFQSATANTFRGEMYAETTGPGFWAVYCSNVSGNVVFSFSLDPVTVPAGVTDLDPCVVFCNSTLLPATLSNSGSSGCPVGWLKKGSAGAAQVRIPACFLTDYTNGQSGYSVFPLSAGDNPHNGACDLQDVMYHRIGTANAPAGRKGVSKFFKWLGSAQVAWTTLNVSGGSKNYFCAGNLAIGPWDGSDPFGGA